MNAESFDDLIPDIGYFNYRNNTPDWKIDEAVTDFVDITYIVSGSAIYSVDKKIHKLSDGDLLCIPKGSLRSAVSPSGDILECFSANFQLGTIYGKEVSTPLPLISHIGYQANIIALYKELNGEWLQRNPGYIMKARAHFMLILQQYFEIILLRMSTTRFDARIKTAIRYMTDHYAEPLNIQVVAELVALSSVYFGSLFKQVIGVTFRQYLTTIRLNHAENMLRNGKHNVYEASRDCGFTDIFYFSRMYKKFKGVPPSLVHKMVEQENSARQLNTVKKQEGSV